jgi:hypothetical protein
MDNPKEKLDQLSLAELRRHFLSLKPPDPGSMQGFFRGDFVGPGWLKRLWGPTLAIFGLGGWRGKEIDLQGNAINIVLRKGDFERRFPMYFVQEVSHLDNSPGLALRYKSGNPFPWNLIVDELRRIDERHVMGMTLAEIGPLRRLGFPFILQQRGSLNELC